MRTVLVVSALALGTAVAASASSGRIAAVKPVVKNTKGDIAAISIDGPIVAYDVKSSLDVDCNKLFTWNVNTGGGTVADAPDTCSAEGSSTGEGFSDLVVAGTRLAWIVNEGGNTESDDTLYAASLPKPKEKEIASVLREGEADERLDGDYIGYLAGDGDLVAVNTFTEKGTSVTKAALNLVTAKSLKPIVRVTGSGKGTLLVFDADLGRIAVYAGPRRVALYSATGKLLGTITTAGRLVDAALRKDYLVAQTDAGVLEVRNANTGKLVKKLPYPKKAFGLDVHSGIAVYALGAKVHAVLLATGRDRVVATGKTALEDVAIDSAGAVYAFNTFAKDKEVGNLGFLTIRQLSTLLAG